MTEHNAPDISVRPVRMAKSRAEKAKFIEIAPGKHIEASVSMRKLEKRIVRLCAMACTDYGMIEDGDKIAVAMSGGKDSYVLLDALLKLKARAPVHFDIIAVHVNQHIPGSPTHLLEAWLKEKGVTYHIENQDTYSITQKLIPSGKNVCSLCARLRRGILYRVAKELGCTKIALGHQMDDVVSTLLLNMFYGGRIKAMPPVLRSDDGCNTVIRPLIYLREYEMSRWAEICGYPLFPKDLCGVGENLKRKEIKALMTQWDKEFDSRIYNLFMSTTRVAASQLADKTLYDFTHFCRIADCNAAHETDDCAACLGRKSMLTITTPAFAHEAEIPMRYTQEGENLSPELVFSGVPANARSLVLLSDDPDAPDPEAPKRIWLHWLVVNIPTETAGFAEGVSDYPQGCRIAVNDSGVRGWSGPRPPIGRHRYYFKLYALDTTLDLPENFTRSQVEAAMAGHVIESAVTMGTYLLSSNR